MREIKFRAWAKNAKGMVSWEKMKVECNRLSLIEDSNFIFMQYTGLKDKNNIEIYEGDIIEYEYIGIVAYGFYTVHDMNDCGEQDVYGYYIKAIHTRPDKTTYNLDKNMEDYEYMEVIGNIYENPELKIYT